MSISISKQELTKEFMEYHSKKESVVERMKESVKCLESQTRDLKQMLETLKEYQEEQSEHLLHTREQNELLKDHFNHVTMGLKPVVECMSKEFQTSGIGGDCQEEGNEYETMISNLGRILIALGEPSSRY